MAWKWLALFRQDRRQAHEAIFDLDQGVIAEQRASLALKDLAEVGESNLETLAQVVEASRRFEGGDQVVADAARAYREGLAALVATPAHLFPAEADARREAMQTPSIGSTASRPTPVNGPPSGSSQMAALPEASGPHRANGQLPEPTQTRRGRGRPKGVPNKPKPSRTQDQDQDQDQDRDKSQQ